MFWIELWAKLQVVGTSIVMIILFTVLGVEIIYRVLRAFDNHHYEKNTGNCYKCRGTGRYRSTYATMTCPRCGGSGDAS